LQPNLWAIHETHSQSRIIVNQEELLYAPTHEWVHVETKLDEKTATVGISAFALEQLSDLVFLELPAVGSKVEAGNTFGEVESVKSVSDIYSPVSGEVVQVNDRLKDDLETLSGDPHGLGWLIKVRMSDDAGLDELLDYQTYRQQCEEAG
jgi:glycine cleavage system H protein